MKTRSIYFLSFIIALASCMKEEPVLFDNQTKCTPMSSTEELALEAVKADKERLAGHEKDSLILTDSKASFGTDANLPTESDDNPDWYIHDVYVLSGTSHTFHISSGIVDYEITPLGESAKLLSDKASAAAFDLMFNQSDNCTLVFTNMIAPKEGKLVPPLYTATISNTITEAESQRILKKANLDYSFKLRVRYRNVQDQVLSKEMVIWPIVGPVTIDVQHSFQSTVLGLGDISQNTPFLAHSGIEILYESADYEAVRIQHYGMPQIWEKRSASVGAGDVIEMNQMFKYVKDVEGGIGSFYDYVRYDVKSKKFVVVDQNIVKDYYDPYLINIQYQPLDFANQYNTTSNADSFVMQSKDILGSPDDYQGINYYFDADFSEAELSVFKSDVSPRNLPLQWLDRHVQVTESFRRGVYQTTVF